jgi:phage-related minor tail protein
VESVEELILLAYSESSIDANWIGLYVGFYYSIVAGSVEERIARIEGVLEEMSKRFNHLESDIANLRSEMKGEVASLRGEMNSLRGEVASLFSWTVGLILGMWITIQATLIPILLRILGAI